VIDYEVYAQRPHDSELSDLSPRNASSDARNAHRALSRQMPLSTSAKMRQPRKRRRQRFASPTARPEPLNQRSYKTPGSATARMADRNARGRIMLLSGGMGLTVAATKGDAGMNVGWPRRQLRHTSSHRPLMEKAGCPVNIRPLSPSTLSTPRRSPRRVLRLLGALDHSSPN